MEVPQAAIDIAEKTINEGTDEQILAFFAFDSTEPRTMIAFKFQYWAFKVFGRYFQSPPAQFHNDFIFHMLGCYYGDNNYLNLGFRGCAKSTYSKLFLTYVLLNDIDHRRKYIKVLTRNFGNAKQMVTDIFNMIVETKPLYGNVLYKEKDQKREETMASFTTVDGVKLMAGTIGMTQRGHIQDAFRPDFLVFDDVEDRESIQSLATTESTIWRIDEAIQGLAADGAYMVNGNYISDEGVIQWFINKPRIITDKITIQDEDGNPTWPDRYDKEKIAKIKDDADDFYGEYMCDPSRADSVFFDRVKVDHDIENAEQPHTESAGVKYYTTYQPHHAYAIGADVGEGVGRDSSTMVGWDFNTVTNTGPKDKVALTYHNNRLAPDLFGKEMWRVGSEFGNCMLTPERNNPGHSTLAALRGYPNLFQQRDETKRTVKVTEKYGWNTNRKTKPEVFFYFRKAYNDGLIEITDLQLLKEMRAYTDMDMQDTRVGMATRHFDLLTAAVIGYYMKRYVTIATNYDDVWEEEEPQYSDIGL